MTRNRYFQSAFTESNMRAVLIVLREAQTPQPIYNLPAGKVARQFHTNCNSGSCSK